MSKSKETRAQSELLRDILSGTPLRYALSVVLGFLVGAVFIVAFSKDVQTTFGYFFSRPGDAFQAIFNVVGEAYGALFNGAIYNTRAEDFIAGIRPLTETLRMAGPLIAAGLGVGLGFKVGLFNIGATGQIVFGLIGATWVSTRMELPPIVHVLAAVIVAIVFSAGWGAIVGLLKAKTGAHEVIVTIMLNYVALNLFTFLLRTPGFFLEAGGGGNPKSDPPAETAALPVLLGSDFRLSWGFVLALLAVLIYWLLMQRSAFGYRFKMVGHNADAARAAGINVERTYIWAMAASAAFIGVAAANQGLTSIGGLTASIHANIGFDAITVALLGGSNPVGVLFAGLLFGAFKAGGPAMQVIGVSPEILGVVQALIVLFIAAPPLIRAIFRLPDSKEKAK
jgi:simple sugar transport system permease protein